MMDGTGRENGLPLGFFAGLRLQGMGNAGMRLKAPPDGAALEKVLTWAIHDYNATRPHTSLQGLTPAEAYSGVGVETLRMSEKVNCEALVNTFEIILS